MLGIRDLAKAAGCSIATVSRALHDDPSVRPETRTAVLAKAREIGYTFNPYVGRLMSSLRQRQGGAFKGNLAIIWVDHFHDRLNDLRDGALARADELGYTLADFNLNDVPPALLKKRLRSRGIRGLIFAAPAPLPHGTTLRLDLREFACVALGWKLIEPHLHTIRFDYYQAMRLALEHTAPLFGAGIAALWNTQTDLRAHQTARASFMMHHPAGYQAGARLFLDPAELSARQGARLFDKYSIRSVIKEPTVTIPDWVAERISPRHVIWFGGEPPDEKRVPGWIHTRDALMGAWGVDQLNATLHRNELGIPRESQIILVPPSWVPVTPKPPVRKTPSGGGERN